MNDIVKIVLGDLMRERIALEDLANKMPTAQTVTELMLVKRLIERINLRIEQYENAPKSDWTLCSDRLPDKTGWYLITYTMPDKTGDNRYCVYTMFRADRRWDEQILYPGINVIAWKEVTPYAKPVL
jgi:hypothetical protein